MGKPGPESKSIVLTINATLLLFWKSTASKQWEEMGERDRNDV